MKKKKNKMSIDNLTVFEIVNWIFPHSMLWEDLLFCFELETDECGEIDTDLLDKEELIDWLSEHDTAWEDFVECFELDV